MLGHADASITLKVYAHLYDDNLYETAKVMDELVTPIPVELKVMAKKDQDRQ
jgi:hypothetical protein